MSEQEKDEQIAKLTAQNEALRREVLTLRNYAKGIKSSAEMMLAWDSVDYLLDKAVEALKDEGRA